MDFMRRMRIIDQALREHYRLQEEKKRVPNDYVLMFTEGGESDAVACAIEKAVLKDMGRWLEGTTEGDIYGDAERGEWMVGQFRPSALKALKRGKMPKVEL